jgi:hypothetical protein
VQLLHHSNAQLEPCGIRSIVAICLGIVAWEVKVSRSWDSKSDNCFVAPLNSVGITCTQYYNATKSGYPLLLNIVVIAVFIITATASPLGGV